MSMRHVLYSPELGVYLGSAMGLGFWSKLDPAGQDAAPTFHTAAEALAQTETWDTLPIGVMSWPTQASDREYATIEDCRRAGLPSWNPKEGWNEKG